MSRSTVQVAKACQITFEPRNQYLYFLVEGETQNYPVMKQYWQDIAQKKSEYNSNLILLENDIPAVVSIVDMFRIVSELSGMGLSGSKLAVVDRYPEHLRANEFAVTVAINRGVRMRTFSSVRDAEKWLMTG
jgi:hypothetical protein